jgi:hypothetical protein
VEHPTDPAAPSTRSHWWSPAPEPDVPSISAKRGYTEVLLVYAAFFLTGVLAAALLLAGRYDNPLDNGSWAAYSPQALDVLAQSGLAIAVVLLLAARRGVSTAALGLTLPRGRDGRFAPGLATRILAWAIFAQVLGGIFNALLQTGHLPTSTPNAPELIFAVTDSIQAGIIEELVVLAFLVVTLRQAGRPWWEVTVVALILRGSYHIYYGPGVVGILVWAALFYWIYLRTRSLIVLMVCHAAWDAVGFLSQRWTGLAVVAILVAVGVWIAAPITWLVERNRPTPGLTWYPGQPHIGWPAGWQGWPNGQPPPTAAPQTAAPQTVAPPGWQPDPAGVHYWRWWDGQRWTDYVSGP